MPQFGSSFFTGVGGFVGKISTLLGSQVYSYKVTTGTDGTVVLDYSALGLTTAPRIVVLTRVAAATDVPLFVNLVGDPTATKATIQARRITSILSLGLVPQYQGVANMTLDVLVRPAA